MHLNQIVHRDFNSTNILIHPLSKNVKIIDFGLSKILLDSSNEICSPQGNFWYRPPKIEDLRNPFFEDVWNFAILALSFFCEDNLNTGKVCHLLKNLGLIQDQRKEILEILQMSMNEAYEDHQDELIGDIESPLKYFKGLFSLA